MKVTKADAVYFLTCNLGVSICISLTYVLLGDLSNIDRMNFLYCTLIGYAVSNLISIFIPLGTIGKWFTKLFKVPADTYKGNMKYRLLSIFVASCIFFVIVNPILTTYCAFYFNKEPMQAFMDWLKSFLLVFVISYCSSICFDFISYRLARLVDKNY